MLDRPLSAPLWTMPPSPPVRRRRGSIDAARLLLGRATAIADHDAAVTPLETTQNLRNCSLAVNLLVTAVDRIFTPKLHSRCLPTVLDQTVTDSIL